MADQAGFTPFQAFLFSLVVYSGSAQMATLSILAAGTSLTATILWSVVALILVMNARYVLFGATLGPGWGRSRRSRPIRRSTSSVTATG